MGKDSRNQSYENMPGLSSILPGSGAKRFTPSEKPRNAWDTFLRLLRMFKKHLRSILVAIFLTLASSLAALLVPLLIGQAVNAYSIGSGTVDAPLLSRILFILVVCYGIVWLLDTVNGVLMAKVTQKLVREIREGFFGKLQRIPLYFYDNRSHGDTMSRMTNDVDNISGSIAQTTTQLISSLFLLMGSLIMMLYLSVELTLLALVTVPLFLLLTRTIATRSRVHFQGQQRKLGELNGIVEESITGLRMVKAFNRQEKVIGEFRLINAELCDHSTKAQIWAGFMMPFMNVISNISFALIAAAGGVMSIQGTVTIGVVVSFLTYSKQFGRPLNNIAGMFSNVQSALVGAERVFEILDEKEEEADRDGSVELLQPKGEIEFSHVSFSYDNITPVLKDVSFRVNPGEVAALVGETGAGKTTIVNLLTRFYDLKEGVITLDGKDIRDIRRRSLLGSFSVVLQDTFLFTGTISENIRYAKPGATEEEVRKASRLAHAEEFILRLPDGYETLVTGSTDNLSQGQRQLIAIARAVLCAAPVLILDEATSSVDTKTEKEIQNAMITLMKDKTSIIIAHRLSTIRNADRIFVIGKGEMIESGSHEELMGMKGHYYTMVMSQMGKTP